MGVGINLRSLTLKLKRSDMKKTLLVLFLLSAFVLFAQKTPNNFFNKNKPSQGFLLPNKSTFSLNLDFLKLEESKKKITSLPELLFRSNQESSAPNHNMTIFEPKGKFLLEIYEVDQNIDHKLKIFEIRKSK